MTVGCVTNILVVALLPDKEWPTVVFRDPHVCSAAGFRMVSMWSKTCGFYISLKKMKKHKI